MVLTTSRRSTIHMCNFSKIYWQMFVGEYMENVSCYDIQDRMKIIKINMKVSNLTIFKSELFPNLETVIVPKIPLFNIEKLSSVKRICILDSFVPSIPKFDKTIYLDITDNKCIKSLEKVPKLETLIARNIWP